MKRLTILLPLIAAFAGGAIVAGRLRPAEAEWAPLRMQPADACRGTATQLALQRREAQRATEDAKRAAAAARQERDDLERDTRELKAQLAQTRARVDALMNTRIPDLRWLR